MVEPADLDWDDLRSALTRAYCRQSMPLPSIWRSAAFQ